MNDIERILNEQRAFFESGVTKDVNFRRRQLLKLKTVLRNNEVEIEDALKKDLNKSEFEAYETEIGMVLEELGFMLKNVKRLTKPKRVKTPIAHFISTSKIYQEPYGIVLVMSPWNYPFQLAIAPLVGAIATGNCIVLKPSEYAPNTSAIIRKLITENFKESYITVVEGGLEVNESLLDMKFDYIFFTGSVSVGKLVMAKAAKHLTPVTLELGGKSPCIVDKTADIALAAKRIAWGKYLNAGQTCVAPDYVLVHKEIKKEFIQKLDRYIQEFYGTEPHTNTEYPKIINQRHYERLRGLMDSGSIIIGGQVNSQTNQIAPTVVGNVTWDSPVMQEEIFGPILPIMEFERLEEVVKSINARQKPLALYCFTRSKHNEQYIIENISFGGGCINDTIVHLANSNLPFGGVGDSGIGSYHGKESFRTFSHSKGVLKKSNLIDIPLRYPPYKNHITLLKKMLK